MQTKLSAIITFPTDVDTDPEYIKLWKYFGSVEHIEQAFQIEFSCGDGKFMSNMYKWTDNEGALICQVTDEELEKYDGNVCLKTPPKNRETNKLFMVDKPYIFVVKCSDKTEEETFFLNRKVISKRHYSNPWNFYETT
jgi:hypothetical protein